MFQHKEHLEATILGIPNCGRFTGHPNVHKSKWLAKFSRLAKDKCFIFYLGPVYITPSLSLRLLSFIHSLLSLSLSLSEKEKKKGRKRRNKWWGPAAGQAKSSEMAQDIEDKKHLFLNHSFPLPFSNMSSALAKLPLQMKRYPTVEDIPLGNQRSLSNNPKKNEEW
ncbi:hypothetical protein PRUPE_6G212500 [Prunus persica]|uniref:Uncharacterized protein n=1 Tax=Prunus persica TaxID=3760 RepID=A0A251NTJ7_PRUPE|nr:hypothetical protein PRUPE_6G212500 [Prunus persica]ONI02650.1 hypothetical protein PRUPE_6G212500 [Prunus persica]